MATNKVSKKEQRRQQLAREKRKKRLLIGVDAKIMSLISRLFPVRYPRFMPSADDISKRQAD